MLKRYMLVIITVTANYFHPSLTFASKALETGLKWSSTWLGPSLALKHQSRIDWLWQTHLRTIKSNNYNLKKSFTVTVPEWQSNQRQACNNQQFGAVVTQPLLKQGGGNNETPIQNIFSTSLANKNRKTHIFTNALSLTKFFYFYSLIRYRKYLETSFCSI